MDTFTVSAITRYLQKLLDSDDILREVWVKGEISNFKRAQSGYLYFTLKDAKAQLKCAMFRNTKGIADRLQDGMTIIASGRISLYAERGDCQLYVEHIRPMNTVGDLYQQFEALKQALSEEGLFEESRKRSLPSFPLKIGVVTSPDAAALQDVKNVLSRRFPLAQLILSPTPVQGTDAPPKIVRAIERLNAQEDIDVILVCRGGGSIEDLWCFNDERVARAIANSRLPVVSGIGHETDFTIADFVADERAPTPSAGIERLTPDSEELANTLAHLSNALETRIVQMLNTRKAELATQAKTLTKLSPQRTLLEHSQRVDLAQERLDRAIKTLLDRWQEKLLTRTTQLTSVNPLAPLARGFARITRAADNAPIHHAEGIPAGTAIQITLQDGTLFARTEDETTHGRYHKTLF